MANEIGGRTWIQVNGRMPADGERVAVVQQLTKTRRKATFAKWDARGLAWISDSGATLTDVSHWTRIALPEITP